MTRLELIAEIERIIAEGDRDALDYAEVAEQVLALIDEADY